MTTRITTIVVTIGVLVVLAGSRTAWAETRNASIGNYWYEDDGQRDRSKIVVSQGDQITFTVREGVYPPHTVDVDELDIHSPELLLGQTFTTPPLQKVGNFKLYCRPHEVRGHWTRLIINAAAPQASPAPAPSAGTGGSPATTTQRGSPGGSSATPAPASNATPAASLTPVGIGQASAESLKRPVAQDPDSLDALIGRDRRRAPWTRSLWFLLFASVPVVGAAGLALRKQAQRQVSPVQVEVPASVKEDRRPTGSARKPKKGSPRRPDPRAKAK